MKEELVEELYKVYNRIYRHKEGDRVITAVTYYEKVLNIKIYETLLDILDNLRAFSDNINNNTYHSGNKR